MLAITSKGLSSQDCSWVNTLAGLQRQSTESGGKTLGLHQCSRKHHPFNFKISNKLLSSAGDLDLDDQLQQFETRPGQSASWDGGGVQGSRCAPGGDNICHYFKNIFHKLWNMFYFFKNISRTRADRPHLRHCFELLHCGCRLDNSSINRCQALGEPAPMSTWPLRLPQS